MDTISRCAASRRVFLSVFFFAAAMCFSHIHQGSLAVDAIRYAHLSKQIQETGDIFHLVDGYRQTPYANKTPFLFWLTARSFDLFGLTTFAAKLPAVSFVFFSLLIVWYTNRRKGELAAALSVLLIIANRSFAQDLVDFGFDGLALFGTALCLLSALRLCESAARGVPQTGLLMGAGMLALFVSKPPYAAFMIVPLGATFLFHGRLKELLCPRLLLCSLLPAIPALAWYAIVGPDYRKQAYDNQLVDSLTIYQGYFQNLLGWSRSFFVTLSPLSLIGLAASAEIFRRRNRTSAELLLALTFVQFIPVVIFVSCRPRYLWSPMLAGALLAGPYLAARLPRLTAERLANALAALALLFVIVVSAFGVTLHRTSPVSEALRAQPELLKQEAFAVCVEINDEKERPRKAQQTALLLEFEHGVRGKVFTAATIPASIRTVLADKECVQALSSKSAACVGGETPCSRPRIIPAQ